MCYTIKEYVYVLILLALSQERVYCWREDHMTKRNIVLNSDKEGCNSYTAGSAGASCDHTSKHGNEGHSNDENVQNYRDRVIFPDQYDDNPSYQWQPTSTTTPSPLEFETCIKTCRVNTTYDPVCGTDDNTYINLERLECRMKCRADVGIRQLSACPEILEPTTKPWPILQSEVLKSCMLLCPSTPEYNPVCGTDDITYYNHGKMICARLCGVDVQVKRQAPCPKQPQSTTETIITSSSLRPYELSKEFLMCLQLCPRTSEYNPVCGTNDKTYYNIGKLYCARSCGIDVTVLKQSPCSLEISISLNINNNENKVFTTTTTTTPRTVTDYVIPQDVLDSIFKNHEDDKSSNIDVRNKENSLLTL